MIDPAVWLDGQRAVDWRVDVVNAAGETVAEPLFAPTDEDGQPISMGSLDFDLEARSLISGTLETTAEPSELIGRYLRPVITVNGVSEPLGLLAATADPRRLQRVGGSRRIEIIDASIDVARDLLIRAEAAPKGTAVAAWARGLLASVAPGAVVSIADSGETMRTDMWWDVGTSQLDRLNDGLRAAMYEPLRITRRGVLAAPLWMPPASKPVALVLDADADDSIIIDDGLDYDTDFLAIPNRVVVHARGGSGEAPIVGLWEDRTPASDWSYDKRGHRWVTDVIRDADVTSAGAASLMARAELIKAQAEAVTVSFRHPWLPLVPGDVIRLRSAWWGIDGLFEIVTQRVDMDLVAETTTTARRVVDL